MTDPIRAAAERLLKYLEANRGHDGMFPLSESQEEFNLRAALAAEPPAPAEPDTDAVLSLAAIIRRVDGSNSLGAAALAEAILSHPDVTSVFQPPAPVPVPVAKEEGEREELAQWLYGLAAERSCNRRRGIRPHPSALTRAAVLLQKGAPAPVPVPVTERPWERPGWCDAEGRCWWFNRAGIPEWQLADGGPYGDFCLPHWAIPQPPQCGEVA